VKRLIYLILIFILFGFNNGCSIEDENKTIFLDEKILKGFEKCEYSEEFKELSLKALKEKTPIEIDQKRSTIKYKAKGKFFGLPIESIEKGVCYFPLDEDSFSCGFAYNTALIIPKPFNEVKDFLKKSTGMDFTKELRDKETEALLRPLLIPYEGGKKSILYCDAGNL